VRGSASTRVPRKALVCLSVVVALGLVAAATSGAATITTWVGGKAAVPQVVTANSSSCPGTVVMITGTGFVSDGGFPSVSIGGVPAAEVIVGSDTVVYARVGANATSGPVSVTTPRGTVTSSTQAIVVPCQSVGAAEVKPTIDSVSPQRAKAGKKLKLAGNGFVGTSKVTVNGEATAYAIPSDNVMYLRVPSDTKSGLATIVVTNSKGTAKVVFQKVG
jgi:IPT/TIG domain